jgi:hypothetical protein
MTTPYQYGPQQVWDAEQAKAVNDPNSFEIKSKIYAEDEAYSYYIQETVRKWRNDTAGFPQELKAQGIVNKWDYVQFLLRATGYSSGYTSQRGVVDTADIKGLRKISTEALANGIQFENLLANAYATKGQRDNEVKFSKQIATSIKLLDATDAKSSLADAYYQAFGAFPTEVQIKNYMDLYNAEAKRQKGKSITSSTTQGGTTSLQTTTMDEGFTDKEQQQFLAEYLSKNFNFPSSDKLGGTAKSIYDAIVNTYKANYLDEPSFAVVTNVIKDVLSSSNDETATQKLNTFLQEGRKVAAKQYIGLANELNAGEDIAKYSTPLAKTATTTLGVTISANDPLIKKALNFKDEKGAYRMMNDLEFKQAIKEDPRYAVSATAINEGASLARAVASGLGQ